ncbi:beta-glucosidase-like glycosyl hydrolase [Thermaerobacter subterraneus DSM 13965]|uniref:beta-N-acetylhexosaminidase n=1 Tax=Thermaerobacter subterraneus DSM 13965 TaxID=867903 RepID=K6NZE5_9FIRM|nr:beta-glucosidase-like glycosyl hydrolase [Thermaerobacter subterraneus DSM 13965]
MPETDDDVSGNGWQDDEVRRGWIQRFLAHMTLEEKVGQMFMIDVYGRTPTDPAYEDENLASGRGVRNFAEAIERYHVGGFIYFNWNGNIGVPLDPQQVQDLSNGLQEIARKQRIPIPLLIATDQEGGIVARVRQPATEFPGNMALGAARSPQLAHQAARMTARELRALGINMNLAPVLDVNVNPSNPVIGVRSFGEDPELVADLGVAQVLGYQDEGVIATVKHFPGHGDTNVDSHYGLPIIHHDRATLDRVDLAPFKAAVAAGVDAVMTAHIVVPALDDSGLPATLSRPILTGLLREELGFDGVIITDALGMQGAQVLPPERIPVEAIKAGADILLMPPDVALAYEAVLDAVRRGEISERRIDQSVARILELKMRRGLFEWELPGRDDLTVLGRADHRAVSQRIADGSITLLRNTGNVLPLQAGSRVLVVGPQTAGPMFLARELQSRGLGVTTLVTGLNPTAAERDEAVRRAGDADVVVVTTYNANSYPGQRQLVERLAGTNQPVVVAATRNPYDAAVLPPTAGYLVTYGYQPVSLVALARVLVGEVNPSGLLPVTIPGLFPYGAGLRYPAP